jgi:hypothetical protein
MAAIKKKPTKAHKSKKVVKAHQGMAHVPRQPTGRPTKAPDLSNATTRKNYTDTLTKNLVANNPFNKPTRRPLTKAEKDQGMRYANPTGTLVSMPDSKPTRRPTTIDTVGKPMDERARRRRDNALKSELDEAVRQANKRPRRPRQPTVQPIRQPTPLGQPMRLPKDFVRLPKDFGGRKPRQPSMDLGPLRNNFNPLESTALTDRFTKPIDRGPMPNARTQRRNKGGDVKKYATGGLNKGMTKSRTKYGTVDNKKK